MSPSESASRAREDSVDEALAELDLRMVPLAAGAWAGAWWACAPGWGGAALSVAAALVLIVGVLLRCGQRWLALGTVLVLVSSGSLGLLRMDQQRDSAIALLAGEQAMVDLVGRVSSDAVVRPRSGVIPESARVTVTTLAVEGRGKAVRQRLTVVVRGTGERVDEMRGWAVGSVVRVQGRAAPPDAGRREAAVVTLRGEPVVVRGAGWGDRQVNRLRDGLRVAASGSRPQVAGLLPSLVVGDTSGLDPELADSFKATGLTHLTAVSGTNLTLTLVFLLAVAKAVGVRGWWTRLVGLVGVAVFVTVCRSEPSVVRAGAMGLVALAGLGLSAGRGRGLRHACTAITVLVHIDPWLGRSLGFALSASATLGILWWGSRWARSMAWAPGWLAEAVAVPLAAQLATQPIVTGISGSVSVVGLAANALAGPLVGPATVLGLVAAIVSLASAPLAGLVARIGGWFVQPIIWIAQWGGSLPGATWRWPSSPAALALLGVACWAGSLVVPWALCRRWVCLLLAAGLAWGSLHAPRPLGWPGPWRVAFCDVGQGDATVLWAGPGQAVLVDVGPQDGDVVGCLHRLGVHRLPLVLLTHFHDDHIAALPAVLDGFPTSRLVVNPVASPVSAAHRVEQLGAAHVVATSRAELGQGWRVGAVSLSVMGTGAAGVLASSGEGESSAENNTSTITVAEVDGLRVVLTGDAEPAAQQEVVARGWQPRVQVLKMPHHGSSRQDQRFWCQSGATLAVASAGFRNDYGHPAKAALAMASRCAMAVARTDLGGTITMWRQGSTVQVRRERDGPP